MNTFPHPYRHTAALAALVLVLLTSGCLRSPETRFFMLASQASAAPEQTASNFQGPKLAVVTTIPAYLDRPQLVTRQGDSVNVRIGEFQQWSEPMSDGVTRVLCDALSARLAANQGLAFPLSSALAADWRLTVNVARFDGMPGNDAVLDALWSLTTASGDEELASGRFTSRMAVGADTADLAEAQSALVSRLAEALAPELNQRQLSR